MNFQRVITENDQFLTGYKNSILTTVPVVVLLMLITSMAAYVLARYTTRVYKWIYLIFIIRYADPDPVYHASILY